MTIRYEVEFGYPRNSREFETKPEAVAYAEGLGHHVSLITWSVSPNLPNCLPKEVYRSCALESYNPGQGWKGHNIHG